MSFEAYLILDYIIGASLYVLGGTLLIVRWS